MEIGEIRYARRDPDLVVLENFHAIKHALRFGGHLLGAWTADLDEIRGLQASHAPDVEIPAEVVDAETLRQYAPRGQIVAVARHPRQASPDQILTAPSHAILLENPRHLGNLGAVIRVAAAAGAAGVLTTGDQNPWHPDAIRGSAGLHFALPVHHLRRLPAPEHPLIALDPEGEILDPAAIPADATLAFGAERHGLTDELLAQAAARVALPMAPGVSSMNLATSVAATLYALKLSR